MKKIFTLFAGLLMAAAVFAADHRPTVFVNSSRNYKLVIDGRTYFGSSFMAINLDNSFGNSYGNYGSYGSYDRRVSRMHTIKVYELRRGFFVRERLVDAATFMVGRNDIMIKIDPFGQIRIREMKDFGRYDRNDRDGRGWNDRDGRSWNEMDWNNGRDFDGHQGRDIPDNHDGRDGRDGRGNRGF